MPWQIVFMMTWKMRCELRTLCSSYIHAEHAPNGELAAASRRPAHSLTLLSPSLRYCGQPAHHLLRPCPPVADSHSPCHWGSYTNRSVGCSGRKRPEETRMGTRVRPGFFNESSREHSLERRGCALGGKRPWGLWRLTPWEGFRQRRSGAGPP